MVELVGGTGLVCWLAFALHFCISHLVLFCIVIALHYSAL